MKSAPEMPSDLDHQAKKKWLELVETCAPDVDEELIANYARSFSNLLAIRREKTRLQKKGKFSITVPGRDGAMVLNPVLVAENRLLASLTRELKQLGLTAPREQQGANRRLAATPAPPGMQGPEPDWTLEARLCEQTTPQSAEEIESERRRRTNQALLASGDFRKYESEFDGGKR